MNKDNWAIWVQLFVLTVLVGAIYDRLAVIIKLLEAGA